MPKLSAMEHLGLPFIRTVVGGSTIPVYLGALNRLTGPWENSGALPAIGRLKVKRHSCSTWGKDYHQCRPNSWVIFTSEFIIWPNPFETILKQSKGEALKIQGQDQAGLPARKCLICWGGISALECTQVWCVRKHQKGKMVALPNCQLWSPIYLWTPIYLWSPILYLWSPILYLWSPILYLHVISYPILVISYTCAWSPILSDLLYACGLLYFLVSYPILVACARLGGYLSDNKFILV